MNASNEIPARIIEVPLEQAAERNAAFVAIFCREIRPYLNYDRPAPCPKDQSFPYVLMQLRWDGVFGFPGGKVNPGEGLRKACVREAKEEIGVDLKEEDLIPVCSHMRAGGDFAAYLYAVSVDPEAMHAAVRSSWSAEDAAAEVCGVVTIRVSLIGTDQGKGLIKFLMNTPMSFSARHEFVLVLERLSLLGEDELKTLREAVRSDHP